MRNKRLTALHERNLPELGMWLPNSRRLGYSFHPGRYILSIDVVRPYRLLFKAIKVSLSLVTGQKTCLIQLC